MPTRSRASVVRALPAAAVLLGAAASCSAPSKGALVLSITTDMETPKDINIVSVFVSTNGVPKFDFLGRVSPQGLVTLPSTLAIVEPDDPSAQVRIRVTAFEDQKARVLRDVVTTVPHERTALLRLPLSFLDDGSAVGTLPAQFVPDTANGPGDGDTQFDPTDPTVLKTACDYTQGQTSIAGTCSKVGVDSATLEDFGESLVFGDGGTPLNPACFPVQQCLSKGAPIDMSTITTEPDGSCSFALTPGESGQHWNCALATTDGTGTCVGGICYVPLESDPGEGFTIQPGKAIVMVPGVCKKLAAGATLYVDRASCSTKTESAPLCEPTDLTAADSGVVERDASSTALDASTAPMDSGATMKGGLPDAGVEAPPEDASAPADTSAPAIDSGTQSTCKTNSDCSSPPLLFCGPKGSCVECLASSDCSGPDTCQNNVCVANLDGG
jgi:hypothetical protein